MPAQAGICFGEAYPNKTYAVQGGEFRLTSIGFLSGITIGMSLQQFDNEDSLRAQRMTADESRAVIALWQQGRVEQTGLTDKPAVPDVAEGLGISVEDVQRLLEEVRAQRLTEKQEPVEIKKSCSEPWREQKPPLYESQTFFVPQPWQSQFQIDQFLCGFLPGFIVLVAGLLIVLLLSAVFPFAPPLP